MIARSRRFLGLAALPVALASALASGCDGGAEKNTLVLWHAWGGSELSALKQIIAGYKARHPGTMVTALQVPYDKLKDKFLRSAAANGGPDVVIGDADWSGKFAQAQLLVPTDTLFSASERARFHPKALASLQLGEHAYALPESRETIALYYNKQLLPQAPTTTDEMVASAAAVAGTVPGVEYGMVFNAKFYYAMGYYFGAGARLFDDAGQVAVDSSQALEAANLIDRFSRSKGLLTSDEYVKGDSLYKEGHTAMILNGPWALVDYQKALGKNLGVARVPRLPNGHEAATWVGVKCFMFNANADTEHRELARDFVLYMTQPDNQAYMAQAAGHIPAVLGVKLPADSPLATFQAQADVGTPVSIRPEVSVVWEPMDKAIKEVIQHQGTPGQALAEAKTMISAKLEAMRTHSK